MPLQKKEKKWFWWNWKYKNILEDYEEYSLYNIIIKHIRFIGDNLNSNTFRAIFLAFKYFAILLERAKSYDLNFFCVWGGHSP